MSKCPNCAALHEELEKQRMLMQEGWRYYRKAEDELAKRRVYQDSRIELLEIRPTDSVLVYYPFPIDREQMAEVRSILARQLPEGVRDRVFIVNGGADLKIMRGPPELHPPDGE